MSRNVTHLQKISGRPGGATLNSTLCGRMTVGVDGMNLTDKKPEVTCKICRRFIDTLAAKLPQRQEVA